MLIESNCNTMVDLILGLKRVGFSKLSLKIRNWKVEIRQIPRMMNMTANVMTKWVQCYTIEFHVFDTTSDIEC